jgi:ATP-dependent RNA helicase DeaD
MNTDQPMIPGTFTELGLGELLTQTLTELGYETPTPIQQQTIPLLLEGRDLMGQAQTGTGKTAAFALPMLERLDLTRGALQALVLVPTRELAIQVSEAIHGYAKYLGRMRVMPIYGGDSIQKQITRLRGPMHVVVGTPGRVIDHLRRGTLKFPSLKMVVLDEADEMLRMGFLDDVEWILEQMPQERQTALFSATMPREVKRITERYLNNPVAVEIKHATMTVPTVEQHFINVSERQKLDALTHLLETESGEGEAVIIFARTKVGAADLAEKLQARGYEAEAMHGGMSQAQRESLIRRMRAGQVDIVVATDVAARGLDVEHIGHVINYDIPNDPESYVHRIGRTGRAGRAGKAVLFVTPRETRMMREIEIYTGQRITPKKFPSRADTAARKSTLFKERIIKTLEKEDLEAFRSLVEELAQESGHDISEIAAAVARIANGDKPLVATAAPEPDFGGGNNGARTEAGMVRFSVGAGRRDGVHPSHIVGAVANEGGVPGNVIGAIDIHDDVTYFDVPSQYEQQVLAGLRDAVIRSRPADIKRAGESDAAARRPRRNVSNIDFGTQRPGMRQRENGGKKGPARGAKRW